jgi:hypothetical protein
MKKSLRQSCFISIENNKNIGCQLFNIAYLIKIFNKSNEKNIKRKIVFRKGNNIYANSLFKGLFTVLEDDKYDKINFERMSINDIGIDIEELSATYKNIEICDTDTSIIAKTFKYIDEPIKNKILDLVYSNEDLMYEAYYKYRDIQDFFGNNVQDKDLVVLHILKDTNIDYDYYFNALSIMELAKIKNCAVITDDIEWAKTILSDINDSSTHIFNYVNYTDNNNYEINFILMSMFKNIIISDNKDDMDSIWASYISHYDIKKVIAPDKNVIHKYITDIL